MPEGVFYVIILVLLLVIQCPLRREPFNLQSKCSLRTSSYLAQILFGWPIPIVIVARTPAVGAERWCIDGRGCFLSV